MCGRYAQSQNVHDLMAEFGVEDEPTAALEPDYNVAPTKDVYAVVSRAPRDEPDAGPRRQLRVMRWGLVPSWAKDPSVGSRMINARLETVATKPAYRRAFAKRRALLPADGYFEWWTPPDGPRGKSGKVIKQPFFISPREGGALAMAGLYEFWRDRTRPDDDPGAWWSTVTVITTDAPDALGRIHDRMPLLVERDRWEQWLDPDLDGASDPDALTSLLVPASPGRLAARPVSTAVGDVRNNGPELLEPIEVEPALTEGMLF
jgi:putative SOS response-associated peptidase YedK